MNSCMVLVKSRFYDLGTPASFKQAISEEGDKMQDDCSSSFSSSSSSSPLARPPPARVFQPTQEPGLWQSLQHNSARLREVLGMAKVCAIRRFFFFSFLKFFIKFSLSEKVPRSDWNCSTIETTEHKLTEKKKELTILFISIFKRKKC